MKLKDLNSATPVHRQKPEKKKEKETVFSEKKKFQENKKSTHYSAECF